MDDPGEREGIGTWKCFDHAVYALPNPGWQLVQHPGFPVYQIVAKKCQMASSIFVFKSYIAQGIYTCICMLLYIIENATGFAR